MTSLKVIKNRIKVIGNTKKITQTMKMVSAAKYTKAEKELKVVRPFGKCVTHFYKIAQVNPPLEVDSQLVIAATGDRGLCGSIHSGIAKAIINNIEENPQLEINTKIICIGEQNRFILSRKYPDKLLWVASNIGKKSITFIDAGMIAENILESQSDNNFKQTLIYYNEYASATSYVISTLNLFEQSTILNSTKFPLYDDVNDETINCWIEFSTAALIYWLMKEEITSELAARMNAMENASKSASEMIKDMVKVYNRSRQATITKELIEIIAGASAVGDK